MFLNKFDILALVKEKEAQQVVGGFNTTEIANAEKFAIGEIVGYLNFRYDTDKIFSVQSYIYSNTQDYIQGDVVTDADGKIYNCIADATAGTALTDTDFFAEGDTRNPLIIMILVDITTYHFLSRIPQYMIPNTRIIRYEQAIKKLENIRKSLLNPVLPLLDLSDPNNENAQTETISIISKEKRRNDW